MSIFGPVYSGLSGMLAFAKGLGVISNNVANLNTPGFKGSELLFRDLFYKASASGGNNKGNATQEIGSGVAGTATQVRDKQGEIQQTQNATDAAIDGNGLFILRDGDKTYYTRVGQFKFDNDGYLVETSSGFRVAGVDFSGQLVDINQTPLRVNPARATTDVTFENNLSTGSPNFVLPNVTIIDSTGNFQVLTLIFTNNSAVTPGSWLVQVQDANGSIYVEGAEIRFQANGSPADGFNEVFVDFSAEHTHADHPASDTVVDESQPHTHDAAPHNDIQTTTGSLRLYFGDPGQFSGATSLSSGADSNLSVKEQNGLPPGSIVQTKFDSDGIISLEYSNGQSAGLARLALARVTDSQALQATSTSLFQVSPNQEVSIGAPGMIGYGKLAPESIEASNVELTQEFTDLIIIQRGYQASSQILNVSNEMIQQLLTIGKSK